MQKIFVKYFLVIMVVTVGITLAGNFFIQKQFAQKKAEQKAADYVTQIVDRLTANDKVIGNLVNSLNENYIARARALGEIIAQNPKILDSFDELNRLTDVLQVDEIHVIDKNRILRWGTVPEYHGMDFDSTDQTRPFLDGITDKTFALAQEPRPNGYEGKLFQYIGVARQDEPGVVQVGVRPQVLDEALKNNQINVVIDNFNVPDGTNVTVFDPSAQAVVGDTNSRLIGKTFSDLGVKDAALQTAQDAQDGKQDPNGVWLSRSGERIFAVYAPVRNYLAEVSFSRASLMNERKNQSIAAAVSSVLLGFIIILSIYVLLKRKIIHDIDIVNAGLSAISDGNLDVAVKVNSTPEFVALAGGIHKMAAAIKMQMGEIVEQSERLKNQARTLKENNLSIMSSMNYARKIQNTLLPPRQAFDAVFQDCGIFWKPRDLVGGDIYWLKQFETGAVLCLCDCTGHGTPGALLSMIVVTALDALVTEQNCGDTAQVLYALDRRLAGSLNAGKNIGAGDIRDGADIAVFFIGNDGNIRLSSARIHVFVYRGEDVKTIKGQRITLGDGSISGAEQIETIIIEAGNGCECFVATDGLFEQVGGEKKLPFGYSKFRETVKKNYGAPCQNTVDSVWAALERYMGGETQRDDITLIGFKL